MLLSDIMNRAKIRLNAIVGSSRVKLWKDPELCQYATNAEREIARRLLCLNESDTIGYVTLSSGASGSITSVSVAGVAITSGAVSFATSLSQTATNLAANINAYTSTPNYRAVSRGTNVIIKAIPGTYPATGYAIATVTSGLLTAVDTDLSGLCRFLIAINGRYFALHEKAIKINRARFATLDKRAVVVDKAQMDESSTSWETNTAAEPSYLITDYDNREIILDCPSVAADMLEVECAREPLFEFSENQMEKQIPEIPAMYHIFMVDWIVRDAFLKNDGETFDLGQAQKYEAEFERQIEEAKRERIRRIPGSNVNSVPGGLL